MKRIFLIWLTIFILTGCTHKNNENDKTLNVSVTFYPLQYYVEKLGGELVSVVNLTAQGGDAHDYEPSIQDRITIEESDLFIYNGFDLEHWVEKTLNSIDNPDFLSLNASKNVDPLYHEDHEDPHVWLSLVHALKQVETIKDELINIDPKHQSIYETNFEAIKHSFEAIDNTFQVLIQDKLYRSFVIEHEIFGYLSNSNDLNQISISGLIPSNEQSIHQLTQIIDFIKTEGVETILLTQSNADRLGTLLTQETGVVVEIIDPMEVTPSDGDYLEIMERNLMAIADALK